MAPHTDSNRGPTDYKSFTLREGLSPAVAADITNFTTIPVSQGALRQQNSKRSSVIVLLGRQVHLASKGVDTSGEG